MIPVTVTCFSLMTATIFRSRIFSWQTQRILAVKALKKKKGNNITVEESVLRILSPSHIRVITKYCYSSNVWFLTFFFFCPVHPKKKNKNGLKYPLITPSMAFMKLFDGILSQRKKTFIRHHNKTHSGEFPWSGESQISSHEWLDMAV